MSSSTMTGHDLLTPLTTTTASGAEIVAWHPMGLLYSAAWATIGLLAAALLFHRLQPAFAENV